MILHNVDQVISQLKDEVSAYAGRIGADFARKGLEFISFLQATDGDEKWIEYTGQLTFTLHHAAPRGIDGKRALPQVLIDPRQGRTFGEILYLTPFENRPWEYLGGRAKDTTAAIAMIVDALSRCEQRAEYLYEDLRKPPNRRGQPADPSSDPKVNSN